MGIRGTPTFLVGLSQPHGKVTATARLFGSLPYSEFAAALDQLLVVSRVTAK